MVRSFAVALLVTVEATRFLNQDRSQSRTMEAIAPYMHSSNAIHQELEELSQRCHNMKLDVAQEGDRSIDVVTVRDPSAQVVNKNFLLFGEHARELISPESGLHFIKTLCGETGLSERAKEVLKDSEFQIVVNGNPESRKKVEQGEFCLRVNPNGVDLNRNWDEEWQPGAVEFAGDTNPGPSAFSEPETRIFKRLVSDYQPTTFLTIHSGTKGMYMPWAYDMEHLAQRNEPEMMQILKDLDKQYCQCPFGAAGREVGYSCPGTCLDYVYDKLNTQYAFAWEIYTSPAMDDMLHDRWSDKMKDEATSLLQMNSSLGHEHFRDIFEEHPSSFVQLRSQRHGSGMSPEECFQQFNPGSQSEFEQVVENWSGAYLDMASEVVMKIRSPGAAASSSASTAATTTSTTPPQGMSMELDASTTVAAIVQDASTTVAAVVQDASTTSVDFEPSSAASAEPTATDAPSTTAAGDAAVDQMKAMLAKSMQ